jgi:hypothetical protein
VVTRRLVAGRAAALAKIGNQRSVTFCRVEQRQLRCLRDVAPLERVGERFVGGIVGDDAADVNAAVSQRSIPVIERFVRLCHGRDQAWLGIDVVVRGIADSHRRVAAARCARARLDM